MISPHDPSAPSAGSESSHSLQALLLALWCAAWLGIQSLMTAVGLGAKAQVGLLLLGLALVFGGAILGARARCLRLLTSVPFAVTQIFFMGLVVALGTFVPQELPESRYLALFGNRFGGWIQALRLGDAFHSLWFLALLAVLALSMLAVAWKRRPYSLAKTGFLLVHIAPTFVLAGGLWGQFAGVKASGELKVGQGTYTFRRVQGTESGKAYVLPGFQVRLERFEVRRRGAESRLIATAEGSGKGAGAETLAVREGQRGKLFDTGLEFEVERLIPQAIEFGTMPVPPTEARDPEVLMVLLGVGSPEPLVGTLQAFGEEAFRKEEPLGRFAVLFRDQMEGGLLASLRPRPPRAERLMAGFGGRVLAVPAKVGERLELPDALLKVVAVYPDFQVRKDSAGRPVMSSGSEEPRDPWLEVELHRPGNAPRRVLLSARQPEYSDRLNGANLPQGLSLRYLREGEETQKRFVVFSRVERRVALVEGGAVVREGTWELNRPFVVEPGLSVTPVGLFDRFYPAPSGATATPGSAALRVKVLDPKAARSERAWLPPEGQARPFFGGRVTLAYHGLADPKELHSTLVIADPQGHELARKEVGVNDPLVYEGLAFLQSPHAARDPEASAILVVDQPGAWIAWLGYALLLIGTGWMFHLKPWLKRRAEAGGAR